MIERQIETPCVKLWMEEGIVYGVYAQDSDIDLPTAQAIVEARIKLSQGKSYPCLIDMRGIKAASKEARAYMADEGTRLIIAAALITGNPFTRTLAHIFLTINKPPVATRLFGDTEAAKEWLKQFVRN